MKLHTDSNYVLQAINNWIHKWKNNGWKLSHGGDVSNREDFEELDRVLQDIEVQWVKVKGHDKNPGNEAADRLANQGAAKCVL